MVKTSRPITRLTLEKPEEENVLVYHQILARIQMGKITNIALAFLVTGFLVGDAYGEDSWEEKAKSLGIPLMPVGTVIMCESELRTGFDWGNGTYRKATFKKITGIKRMNMRELGAELLELCSC